MVLRGPEAGFEAYRLIYREMERMQPTRKASTVEDLLTPTLGESPVWRKNWLDWEAELRRRGLDLDDQDDQDKSELAALACWPEMQMSRTAALAD